MEMLLAAQLEAHASITGGGGAPAVAAAPAPAAEPIEVIATRTAYERKVLTIDDVLVDYTPGLEWEHLGDSAVMRDSGFCPEGQHVDAARYPQWAAVKKGFIEEMPENKKKAFDKPTEIQCSALPRLLAPAGAAGVGKDMIFQAPTGTGKTGAFVGAALCEVDTSDLAVQVLMLAPTRHVADIHANTARSLGKYINNLEVRAYYRCVTAEATGKGCRCAAPGAAEQPHTAKPGQPPPCHVLTGTAGKLINVAKTMDPSKIKVVVVDEADVLYNNSKSEQVREEAYNTDTLCLAIKAANPSCRFILASATAPALTKKFYALRFRDACTIYQKTSCMLPETITIASKALPPSSAAKSAWVAEWCIEGERAIVFADTREEVKAVHKQFVDMGVKSGAIHGGMKKALQDAALAEFQKQRTSVLVSSSIIERGIDLEGVTHVVLYQPPTKRRGEPDLTAFIQKVGRCGRSGSKGIGVVITSSPEEEANLGQIAEHFSIDVVSLVGDDVDEDTEQLNESGK